MEHRIGGRLQIPLRTSAESFVDDDTDDSFILILFHFFTFEIFSSRFDLTIEKVANLLLHLCGIYEYLNELRKRKKNTDFNV